MGNTTGLTNLQFKVRVLAILFFIFLQGGKNNDGL